MPGGKLQEKISRKFFFFFCVLKVAESGHFGKDPDLQQWWKQTEIQVKAFWHGFIGSRFDKGCLRYLLFYLLNSCCRSCRVILKTAHLGILFSAHCYSVTVRKSKININTKFW
jgi:hypothetical protein